MKGSFVNVRLRKGSFVALGLMKGSFVKLREGRFVPHVPRWVGN